MFRKTLFVMLLAAMCSVFFCGCDPAAIERMAKAANNTEAEEKEAKRVTKAFFEALTTGNPGTAEYYLASDAKFDREKMRDGSKVMAAMGGWEIEVLDASVSGSTATVDVMMKLYGQEDKKSSSCFLKKENGKWKVVSFE